MTVSDATFAVQQIDTFLRASEEVLVRDSDGFSSYEPRDSSEVVGEHAHVVEMILDRVLPNWRSGEVITGSLWTRHRHWAVRARAELLRGAEVRAKLGDDAPEMSAARLHLWVWEAAAPLWRSGHRALAVGQAATRVSVEAQAKSGRRDIAETELFNQLFKPEPPKAGEPRLRLPLGEVNERTHQSVHRGVRSLAEGLYAALRNPLFHEVAGGLDEQEALEQLAAFSLLARWVDAASIETT